MRNGSVLPAVMIATLAIFLTGCSRNPVAPTSSTTGAPGAGTTMIGQVPDDPPTSDGGTPSARTVTFTATEEGVVSVGRFSLWVRKNSLRMPATITLHVTDPEALECQISVSPAAANDFQTPVVLYANMSDDPDVNYDTATMLVWNGTWAQWTDVASHPNQQNIVAHFTSLTDVKIADGGSRHGKLGA